MKINKIIALCLKLSLITLIVVPSKGSEILDNNKPTTGIENSSLVINQDKIMDSLPEKVGTTIEYDNSDASVSELRKRKKLSKIIETKNSESTNLPPKTNNFETIVRLMRTAEKQKIDVGCSEGPDDYIGMEMIFETRDKNKIDYEKGSFCWAAKVAFRPQEDKPHTKAFETIPSKISINYIYTPEYKREKLSLGDLSENTNSAINKMTENMHPLLKDTPEETYKKWLQMSYYEWILKDEHTIMKIEDLEETIHDSFKKNNGKLADYYLAGYDRSGGSLNCVTASMTLLEKKGIQFSKNSEFINSYLNWKEPTPCGKVTNCIYNTVHCLNYSSIIFSLYTSGFTAVILNPKLIEGCAWGCACFCVNTILCNGCCSGCAAAPLYGIDLASPSKIISEIFKIREKLDVKIVKLKTADMGEFSCNSYLGKTLKEDGVSNWNKQTCDYVEYDITKLKLNKNYQFINFSIT